MAFTVAATILQTPTPDGLEVLEDHTVTVGDDGRIVSVEPGRASDADVVLDQDTVLLPGLIDTHIHAPQWPQLGAGLDLPLDTWLFEHTFPLEARFADTDFAVRVWDHMVPSLLAGGTTTAVYYASVHEEATLRLAQACAAYGQRAFVGRVAMDHPEGTPEWYRDENAQAGLEASARSVQQIRALDDPLVRPILTPRFIPACTDELLAGMGELAESTGAVLQTHCSENDWEHGNVLERFGVTDTEALGNFGLIRDHTVLAHSVLISDADRSALIAAGAGVAHCPLSNSYFGSAVFPARRHLAAGLRIGLGTDIAGGPESSMLKQCGHAVNSARMLEDGVNPELPGDQRGTDNSRIEITTAFYMATVGGADLLGIDAGLLAPGNVFDAIAVRIGRNSSAAHWPEVDDWPRVFEKALRLSASADIEHVWVNGQRRTS